jgi:hypothetical protein
MLACPGNRPAQWVQKGDSPVFNSRSRQRNIRFAHGLPKHSSTDPPLGLMA